MPLLGAYDFDGTAFKTSEDSPNGMNVERAYAEAIEAVFGSATLEAYRKQGGLKNGDPIDVIKSLWPLNCRELMLRSATKYFDNQESTLRETIGESFDWSDTSQHFTGCVELLVYEKLRLLLPEIGQLFPDGSVWPRPVPGFLDYWQQVSENPALVTGILSSGHDLFIKRTFEVYDLPQADELVTNDLMRSLRKPASKPDPHCLRLLGSNVQMPRGIMDEKVYFGDDPKKDGVMAAAAGWPFFLVDPDSQHLGEPGRFDDWTKSPWPKT